MATEKSSKTECVCDCCAEMTEGQRSLYDAVTLVKQKAIEIQAAFAYLEKVWTEENKRMEAEVMEKLKSKGVPALESCINELQQECDANDEEESEEENKDEIVEGLQACLSEKEDEISRLKELVEQEKIRADTEKDNINAVYAQKLKEAEKMAEDVKALQASISEKEREINRLNQLLERETTSANTAMKIADKEKRNGAELHRLLEAEKKKSVKKDMQLSKIEAQKAEEKRQADIEVVKLKKLLEDNLKRAMEKETLADHMSQKLKEKNQTIEALKQKLDEHSSLNKSMETYGVSSGVCVNAESDKVRFLEERLELETSRVKHEKEKYKLKASLCNILQNELGRLKLDFSQVFQRLNALDTLVSPDPESMHGITKSHYMPNIQNLNAVTQQVCNPNISQMYNRICNTSMDAFDPLRKHIQHTPLLASSGVNIAATNSNTASFSNGQLMGSQEGGALKVIAKSKNINVRPSMFNPSESLLIEHNRKRKRIADKVGDGPAGEE